MTGSGAHIYNDGRMALGNSTQNLVWDGTNLNIRGDIVAYGNLNGSAVGQIIAGSFNFVPLTSPGSGTFTVPANVYKLKVTCIGGGGGGGRKTGTGTGTGGGGGGACIKVFNVTPGASYTYVVGYGGTKGAGDWTYGQDGGNSTFSGVNAALVAYGGKGGYFASSVGGAGGIASGGDINLTGTTGGQSSSPGGVGGSAPLIGVGTYLYEDGSPNSGSGGGGSGTAYAGGNGGSGLIIIEY